MTEPVPRPLLGLFVGCFPLCQKLRFCDAMDTILLKQTRMLYVNGKAIKNLLLDVCALFGCQVHGTMWMML